MNMQTVTDTVKAAPPITVGMSSYWGWHPSELAQILAIIWTVFLIIEKLPVVIDRLQSFAKWVLNIFKKDNNGL
jgi:hypothetical protein